MMIFSVQEFWCKFHDAVPGGNPKAKREVPKGDSTTTQRCTDPPSTDQVLGGTWLWFLASIIRQVAPNWASRSIQCTSGTGRRRFVSLYLEDIPPAKSTLPTTHLLLLPQNARPLFPHSRKAVGSPPRLDPPRAS